MAESAKHETRGTEDARAGRRRVLVAAVLGAFALAGLAYFAYWLEVARYVESTDDAYVGGNLVEITPQVAGIAVEIGADDTQFVRAGQPLVRLDRAKLRAELLRDEASLGESVREVRNLFARVRRLRAAIVASKVDLARARADLARREHLARSGAVSAEDVQHARDAVRGALAKLEETRAQLAGLEALTAGTTVASNPRVAGAAARLRATYLDYRRSVIPAPVSGFIARRTVQLGQRVSPGMPLMAVVPLDEVWVDANFKEGQLAAIRAGQPVRLRADANDFEYHGTVVGFAPGTGASFAVLPPQNATGNWIKVVQRLPVRIALDRKELAAHPLQIGLSMEVRIDVRRRDAGPRRTIAARGASPRAPSPYRTVVFERQENEVDALIERIIAENEPAFLVTTPARHPSSPAVDSDPIVSGVPSVP